ncbi:MAG: hypothetical protein JWO82_834 [Akkermansiaceae bacterium]|nr:hypothetical protein [Akkermansiaceae bacterium]
MLKDVTPPSRLLRNLLLAMTLAGGALHFSPAHAEAARDWTDTKGRTVSAVFVRQDADNVWIKRSDGREVEVPKNTLSDADQIYLASVPTGPATPGGAVSAPGGATKSGLADFNTVKVDPTLFKPHGGGLALDGFSLPNTLETGHFVIAASDKTKPAVVSMYAEAAERTYLDIVAALPSIATAFEDHKKVIILYENEAEGGLIESWHSHYAASGKPLLFHDPKMAERNIGYLDLHPAEAEKLGYCPQIRTFRLNSKTAESMKKNWGKRVHFLVSDILNWGARDPYGSDGYSFGIITLCYSYEREFAISGKIETEVIMSGAEVEGFKNGKAWAAATKKLLKNGGKPDIDAFLHTLDSKAAPRDLGFGFGLIQFIRKDPARLAGLDKSYAALTRKRIFSDPKEFIANLGYDSPEAFNAAWLKYLESDAFQ